MRLTDLKPKWMEHEGKRVAIIFLCPRCVAKGCPKKPLSWLTCFFVPLPMKVQREMIAAIIEKEPADFAATNTEEHDVVGCEPIAWKRDTKILENMTVTPSLNAERSGHWHGHITEGQIR